MELRLSEKQKACFWAKVQKTDSCWEWKGFVSHGYGSWRIKNGNFRAHRVSYELAYGEIPEGKRISHQCNNQLCVNPAHLVIEMPLLFGLTNADIARFWEKVQKTDSCWEWTGTTQRGYGLFRLPEKNFLAHRLSYQFVYEEIPQDRLICHRCNNRICVNPDHLYAGTSQDNVNDAIACGHQIKGISHHQHKLTEEQVQEIRQLYPGQSLKKLAALYGVDRTTIWSIATKKTWRHI